MSSTYLRFFVRLVQLLGLLPFDVRFQPEFRVQASASAVFYSTVCGLLFSTLNVSFFGLFVGLNYAEFFVETSQMVAISMGWASGVVRSYVMYIVQIRRRNEIIELFDEVHSIAQTIREMQGGSTAEPGVPEFLDAKCRRVVWWKLGSMVAQCAFVVFSWVYTKTGEFGGFALVQFLLKFVLALGTDVVTLVYTALHFAVTLAALQFYRAINDRLRGCIEIAHELQLLRRAANGAGLRVHSNIDADIGRISLLYGQVTGFAQRSLAVISVPLIMVLVNSFLYILESLYNIVHDIGKIIQYETADQPPYLLYNIAALSFYVIEIMSIVWISNAVIEEANKTGRILCRTASFQIDIKTKESIELFSLRILQGQKLMVACGMFTVDKTLVYGMVGTLTTYLTILIQFDLANNSASNK